MIDSVPVPGAMSISNFQSNSLYKPKAKTNVQHSPFISLNSDPDFEMEDPDDIGSVTEVNQPMRYVAQRPKSNKFGDDFQSQRTVDQGLDMVSHHRPNFAAT